MSHVKTTQFNTDNVSRKLYYANILICLIRNSSEEGYLVQVDKFFISFFCEIILDFQQFIYTKQNKMINYIV